MASKKLRVDVWSDIACPWCYVGKRRLEAALEHRPLTRMRAAGVEVGVNVLADYLAVFEAHVQHVNIRARVHDVPAGREEGRPAMNDTTHRPSRLVTGRNRGARKAPAQIVAEGVVGVYRLKEKS